MSFIEFDKDICNNVYDYYRKNICNMDDFDFSNIYYTDDFTSDESLFLEKNCVEDEFTNGVTILPNELLEETIVLVNIKCDTMLEVISTLFHELTHVRDFIDFTKHFFGCSYKQHKDVIKIEMFNAYRYWSEFHAFSVSFIHQCGFADSVNKSNIKYVAVQSYENKIKDYIIKMQCKFQNKGFDFYELSRILAYIFIMDDNNSSIEAKESCISEYMPMIFCSQIAYQIYSLYEVYCNSVKDNNVLCNLGEMKQIHNNILNLLD